MLRVAALALLVLAVAAYPADYRGSVPEKCDGENRLSPGNEYTYNYTVEGYRKPLTEVEDKILWFKWQCSAHIKVYGPCEMVLSTPYCEVLKAVTSDMEEDREYRTFPHGKSYTREFTEDVDLPFYMNLGEVTSVSPKVDGPLHVLNLHRDLLSLLQLPTTLDDLEQITAHRSVHGDCTPKYEITDSVDLSGTSVALGVRMVKDMSKCQHPDNVFQDEVMDETLGDASQQCDYVMSEEGRIDKVTCREQTPDNYLHHNNPFLIANNTRKLVFIKKDPLKVLRSEDAYDKEGRYKDDLIFKIDEPVRPKSPKRKTPSDCKPVRCRMFCKFGWQIDENGCEMCRCNEPGQYLMDKEKCIGRNRFEPGRRYIYNYTVEGKKESPAHMGKTLWLRSTYRVVLDAIDACHAIITTPKCEILNAETSDDSESPQYSSFAQGDQYAKAFTQDYPLIVYWNKGLVEVIAPQVDMPVYILNMRREILSLLQMPIDVPEGREMIRNVYGECRPEFEITDKKVFLNNRVVTGVNVRNELTQCKHPDSSWEEVFGVQLTNATRECKYHLNAKDRIQKVSCKEVMEDASLSYNNPFMIANSRSTLQFLGTRSLPDPVPELSMENRRRTDLVFEMEEQADSQSDVKSEEKDPKVEIITEKIEVVPLPIVKNQKGDPLKRSHVAPFDCEGEKELCQFRNGASYRGKVSVTESGKTCQRWDSHPGKYTAANYPSGGLEQNYCRNPDGHNGLWCYTTDNSTEWERCDVPVCDELCQFRNGTSYRGKVSVTESGKTCQRWDSHPGKYTAANYPSGGLEENFCRNVGDWHEVWCYTTDNSTEWERCDVPVCDELCQEGNGTSYRGKVSVTESGKTCQRWDSQTPHEHDWTSANYPYSGLEENYCRNVGDWSEVWCYTTDPNTRWERCDVPVCGKNQFKPGNRYLYGYYGKAQGKKSGEQGKDGYWVTARCWVEIEATSKCGFFMKTSNCVFRDSEPRVPGDKVDKEFHKLSANLQENPIYVELHNGLVHRLVVDPSESTHILNTKRAILSTLQMQLEGNPQLQKTITQNDIYGECPVNYVVSEVDNGHVVGMNVTKHVSFCQHPKEEMTHKISQSHSGASQTCRADLTFESVIERVICKDVRPVREDRMIETHRILVLQHVRPLKASEPQYSFDIEEGKETTLTYEAEGEPMDDLEEGAMKETELKSDVEAKNPCKPVLCKMYCEHGFRTDKRGCEICECAKEGEGSCVDDDGITRKNGDKWRPSFDEDWCNSCHCENGKVACLGVVCARPDCGNEVPVKKEGQCCPVCPGDEKPQKPEKPGDIKEPVCSTKGGKTYKDGDMWEEADCTKCMCMEGEAVCTSVLCEVPDCGEDVEPIMKEGDCCPTCPGQEKCTSADGKEYVTGETWEEDGSCTTCRCEAGKPLCMSMMCDWPDCGDGVEPVTAEGECCPSCPGADNPLKKLVFANGKFALDLYKKLTSQSDGNMFVSPLSISTALAMTYLAAKGKTAEQMGKTMHFDELSELTLHKTFAELTETTSTNTTAYTLSMANRLFVQEDFDLLQTYVDGMKQHYGAEAGRVNFGDTKVASDMINNWVEEKTQQKIQDLINEDMLSELTRLVLINAIYFKAKWNDEFDPFDTEDRPFFKTEEDSVDVPTMHREGRYNLVMDPEVGCSVLELPYKEKDLSMLVIVPTEKEGLSQVEDKITMETLQEWREKIVSKLAFVYLPKFKLEYAVTLTDHLKQMGMEDLFDASLADLSGLTGAKDLHVSDVVHKAFVEVYEKGSEAAAATGVIAVAKSGTFYPEPPPIIRADRPFLFLIRDNRNDSILFIGRVTDPTGNK